MFLNETVKLSLDDYETYVRPILTESPTDIYKYSSIFYKKYLEENESTSRKEVYSLFRLVCSLDLNTSNPESPFDPMITTPSGDSGRLSDIPENHQVFLQEILQKITTPIVQARVADILWIIQKKNKKENAEIALKSYMLFIENNLNRQEEVLKIIDYSQRVLFLLKWTRNAKNHQEIIKKFENLIKSQEEISCFFIKNVIPLLINKRGADKNLLVSILKSKVENSNCPDDWQSLEKVYNQLKEHSKVNERKIRQGEIYAQYGDQAKDNINKICWYEKSLEIYPNTKETKDRIKEINNKLSIASSNSPKEMQHYKVSLPQDCSDYIQNKSIEIKEKISGLSFLEALKALVIYIEYPSVDELKQKVEIEQSNPLGIFSPVINSFQVTNVNLQSRCESLNLDNLENVLAIYFTQQYFPFCTSIMLNLATEGLEIIRKEHNNIKEDDWITILKKSIIPQERLESFGIGFYNWFYKRNLVALPILIPQFENLVRYLIQDSQNDTAVYRNKERKQEEESFKNNFNNGIIENKLGQDLVFQFKVLLFANGGFNLRNKIEHGLVDDLSFSDLKSDYLVLLMLKVVLFYISK